MPLMMMIYAYSHLLNIFDTVSLTCTQFKGGLYSKIVTFLHHMIAHTQICLMLEKAFLASYSGTSEATAV